MGSVKIPGFLLRSTLDVQLYAGTSASGPVHGPRRRLRVLVDEVRRTGQTQSAKRVQDATVLYAQVSPLSLAITPQALAWLDGRKVEVVQVRRHHARVGTPDHVEITVR